MKILMVDLNIMRDTKISKFWLNTDLFQHEKQLLSDKNMNAIF